MRGSADGSVESKSSMRPSSGCPLRSGENERAKSGALAAAVKLKTAAVIIIIATQIIFMDWFVAARELKSDHTIVDATVDGGTGRQGNSRVINFAFCWPALVRV